MEYTLQKRKIIGIASAVLGLTFMLAASAVTFAQEKEIPEATHDGLVLVPERTVAAAYVDPDADFSVYNKILLVDCAVAFRKNWQKRQKRTGSRISVSGKDMENIKADVAKLFREVFIEELSKDGGYEIVDAAGEDVLLIRPAIIDLDISAPDKKSAGETLTFSTSAGAATIYLELYDSVTGDILARAADRKGARTVDNKLLYTNHVTNKADARRMLGHWAALLRGKLDDFHGK